MVQPWLVRHQVPWVDCWLGWRRRRFMRRWRWGGGRGRVFQQGRKRGAACSWVRGGGEAGGEGERPVHPGQRVNSQEVQLRGNLTHRFFVL